MSIGQTAITAMAGRPDLAHGWQIVTVSRPMREMPAWVYETFKVSRRQMKTALAQSVKIRRLMLVNRHENGLC